MKRLKDWTQKRSKNWIHAYSEYLNQVQQNSQLDRDLTVCHLQSNNKGSNILGNLEICSK